MRRRFKVSHRFHLDSMPFSFIPRPSIIRTVWLKFSVGLKFAVFRIHEPDFGVLICDVHLFQTIFTKHVIVIHLHKNVPCSKHECFILDFAYDIARRFRFLVNKDSGVVAYFFRNVFSCYRPIEINNPIPMRIGLIDQ